MGSPFRPLYVLSIVRYINVPVGNHIVALYMHMCESVCIYDKATSRCVLSKMQKRAGHIIRWGANFFLISLNLKRFRCFTQAAHTVSEVSMKVGEVLLFKRKKAETFIFFITNTASLQLFPEIAKTTHQCQCAFMCALSQPGGAEYENANVLLDL